mgnify:FL=1
MKKFLFLIGIVVITYSCKGGPCGCSPEGTKRLDSTKTK